MTYRKSLRILFAAICVISVFTVGFAKISASTTNTVDAKLNDELVEGETEVAPPATGTTVITTDSNQWKSEVTRGPRSTSEIIAINPDGTVRYYNESHDRYWDVDPIDDSAPIIEYTFADHLEDSECPTQQLPSDHGVSVQTMEEYADVRDTSVCTRNGVERVNLQTGEVTRIWSRVTPGKDATRYHDIDRLDDERLVVADIYFDRVFIVNTTSDEIEWQWNANDDFSNESGGPYPEDWTHINDVEVVDNERIMVSLRNHDQVVFLDESGMNDHWTLGADDEHDILHEQHNPDFIPRGNGGPAILVADSENNRVVEYQRVFGDWERSWLWEDARLQWPRDADRLPNGHTLITDSNGDRVFTVDEQGRVVWSINIAFPYEAERLRTGDESTNGRSIRAMGGTSRPSVSGLRVDVKKRLPGKYLNGVLYLTPVWFGFIELGALVLGVLVALTWITMELRWANVPRRIRGIWEERRREA